MQESYGRRLRLGRQRLGLTQQQLAVKTGVHVATIRDLEQGRSTLPRGDTLHALAMAVAETPAPAAAVTGIDVLGPLRMWRGSTVAAVGNGGHRLVLARLALTPHKAVHRDELVDLLWAARSPASAVNMVHAHISRIRRLLRGRDGTPGPMTVESASGGYQLELPEQSHDASRFGRLGEADVVQLSHLEAALDLWRGHPVEDVAELAAHPAAARWERRRLAVAARFARLAQQEGDVQRVLPRLRELVDIYPLDEGLQQHLIEALVADGQVAAARLAYQIFTDRLAAEAGVPPNPVLLDTIAHLLAPPPPAASPRPELSIRLLGPVEVASNRRPVPVSRSQRRGVLALLAIRTGNVVSPAEIVEALWGDRPPATATRQVHSAIASLRKILSSAGLWDVLESTAGGYRLVCPPERIDVHVFEDLIDRAHRARAAGGQRAAGELLTRAAGLWRGMPLGAASGFFVAAKRARLEMAYSACLEELANAQPPQNRPAAQPHVVPAELPRRTRHLVGRENELARLNSALASLDGRPATIVIAGPAGVGKTELACAWCHDVKQSFPDGQLFVTLNGFHDVAGVPPERALEAMLRSLDVPPERIPGSLAQRAALWRSLTAGKRLLVVIDDAPGSEPVRSLLPGDGGALTVVTSRRRLSGLVARDDAVLVPLGPLTGAQSRTLLEALLPPGAPVDVEAVARHCAGLPLALRIAGARLRLATASAANVVSLLESEATRLSALSIDDSAVRAELMSSYEALTHRAAAMLRVLAAHPGLRPSLAVCAAMAGQSVDAARDSLDHLAEAHLVDECDADRYELHDLVRLFARERLARNEEGALLRRAVGWYVHAGHLAGGQLRPASLAFGLDVPAPDPATMPAMSGGDEAAAWLDAEIANIEALIRGCHRRGWHDAVWRLAHAPMPLLGMRRSADAWMGLLDLGRAAAHRDGHDEAEAFFHNALGIGAAFTKQYQVAEKHFSGALRLQQRRGDTVAVTACRLNLGALHGDTGKVTLAVRELTAIVEQERRGSGRFLGPALNSLCENLLRQGRYAECCRFSQEAYKVASAGGDVPSAAHAQSTLADAQAASGRPPAEAAATYENAVDLARQCGDTRLQARTLRSFGDLLSATGRAEPARAQWTRALALFGSLNSDEAESVRQRLATLAS
ncbi:MAG TPA: BTAD domain-containing putative transcriptional regulator [Candidatus Limnocylindrales bacterium]